VTRPASTSSRLLGLLLLAGVLLTGCPAKDPVAPGEEFASETPFASDPTRSGEAIIQGSVTLQGATTTDTAAYTAPFIATLPGKSGEIALVALGTDQLDTPGSGNRVLYTLKAGTSTLLSKAYVADTTPDHQPILLLTNDPLKLTLYNSELANSTLHSKRMRWQGSIQTVRKEDIDEPNDDENQATRTDRTLGAALAESTPIDRSFYRRTAVTAEDIEDWYTINVNAGQAYVVDFTNQNGVWSTFTFVLRVVDNAGNTVAFFSNHKTAGLRQLSFVPTTTGTYYLQVAASPSTRKGSSVYYAPYQLQYRPVAAPQVTSVTLQDAVTPVGTTFQIAATVEGEVTSYNWDLGNGFRPMTDTRASFSKAPTEPGLHTGSLTVSGPWGTSAPLAFSYQIMPTSLWWSDKLPKDVVMDDSLRPTVTFSLPEGRCGLLVKEDPHTAPPAQPQVFWFYYSGPNGDLRNWSWYALPTPSTNSISASTVQILGTPAFVTTGQDYYRATKPMPLSAADWYHSTFPASDNIFYIVMFNVGSRAGIAYADFDAEGLYWSSAADATPDPADWTEHVIDDSGFQGYGLAGMKYQNRPALAYLQGDGTGVTHTPKLEYARASISAPTSAAHWSHHTVSETALGEHNRFTAAYTYDREIVETPNGVLIAGPSLTGLHLAWTTITEPTAPGDWTQLNDPLGLTNPLAMYPGSLQLRGNELLITGSTSLGTTRWGMVLSPVQPFPWTNSTVPFWLGTDLQSRLPDGTGMTFADWTAFPDEPVMIGTFASSTPNPVIWRATQ